MIEEFDNLNKFILKIDELIDRKYFEHYMLINAVSGISHFGAEYFESFTIGTKESWIVGFCFQGNYMLFGKNWKQSQISLVQSKIKQIKYQKGFHFLGSAELIKELTSYLKVIIFKDRIYYLKTDNSYLKFDVNCELALVSDIDQVSQMMCDYFEDEYEGLNNKQLEKMKVEVASSIDKGNIWVYRMEGDITSMCSTIMTEFDSPIIGSFFTKRNLRNYGYGTKLLSHVSNKMIKQFGIVTLLADKNHIESIKVFMKLHFENVYETLEVIVD